MGSGNWIFVVIGCVIEFALAGASNPSNIKLPKVRIRGKGDAASNTKRPTQGFHLPLITITPQPSPLTEVSNHSTNAINGIVTPKTPSVQVYRRPFRNRTVFPPRGPRWDKSESGIRPTDESDLPNSTFVGIITGATILFMLVWLPCYLYSETCLGGRSDNTSQGSGEDISEDLETSDHPPSYNEALSSRTVSTFSFPPQRDEDPPPSYDSLHVLIQDLDKGVCRVTASTSYYSYRQPTQIAGVSSSRSFHGTSSQFMANSLYRTPNKLFKGKLPIRSLSFFEHPTLTEVGHAENPSSPDSSGETSGHSGNINITETSSAQNVIELKDYSVFSDVPDYPPPTYRDECVSTPSSDSSSSLLTVIEANSNDIRAHRS